MLNFNNIKRFGAWKNKWGDTGQVTLSQYISFNIHPEDVLILGSLFFPNFIEVGGCVLLSNNYNSDTFKKMKLNSNNQSIERNINRVYIYDIFANCGDDVEEIVFERVGKLLQTSWSTYLNKEFPKKKINVDYCNNLKQYGPTLTVYQEKSGVVDKIC